MLMCANREVQALRADVLQNGWDRVEDNARKEAVAWPQVLHYCVYRGNGGGDIGKGLTLSERGHWKDRE